MKSLKVRLFLSLLLCLIEHQAFASQDACDTTLPVSLSATLKRQFADWKLVRRSDLSEEDQALWKSAHDCLCPGIAIGNFTGKPTKQYAVLLWRDKPSLQLQLIYAVQKSPGSYKFTTLTKHSTDRVSVVFSRPPGAFGKSEIDDGPVRAAHDVVVLETIEAGSSVFYYDKDKFKSLVISE